MRDGIKFIGQSELALNIVGKLGRVYDYDESTS